MRRILLLLALCPILAGARCFRPSSDIPPQETPVRLVVRNDYGIAVEVYAIGSGITQRLGTVHPGMTGRFEVPRAIIGGLAEFEARATIRDVARSGPLNLQPGHVVEFEITRQLTNSTARILP